MNIHRIIVWLRNTENKYRTRLSNNSNAGTILPRRNGRSWFPRNTSVASVKYEVRKAQSMVSRVEKCAKTWKEIRRKTITRIKTDFKSNKSIDFRLLIGKILQNISWKQINSSEYSGKDTDQSKIYSNFREFQLIKLLTICFWCRFSKSRSYHPKMLEKCLKFSQSSAFFR